MVVAVWSVKGGVGVTSVAAMLAIGSAERAQPTTVVDLCGDLPTVFGHSDQPEQPGLGDWWVSADRSEDTLQRLHRDAGPDLQYLPRGHGPLENDPHELMATLDRSDRQVIVDCGVLDADSPDSRFCSAVATSCTASIVVLRQCFMTLQAMHRSEMEPTGVLLIREAERYLGRADVEAAAQAPIIAEIAYDSAVFRSIDAGLVRGKLPRRLVRTMAQVVRDAA